MKKVLAVVFILLLFATVPAQTDTMSALVEQLTKNRRMLKLENARLTGEGAEFMLDEARSARFFLIGEDHGIADMPIFTETLFRQINPFGYQTFATEAGPLTAVYLEKMAKQPGSEKAFADFNARYPFGLPFYNWKEEAHMAGAIVKSSGNRYQTLWGLDQEFIASPAFHLKRLAELAATKQEKAVANEYYAKTKDEFGRIVETKNPGLAFLASAKEKDFDRLDAAFKTAGPQARKILDELRESWEIYQKNFKGQGYESNLQRSRLMKRHFMAYYGEALRLRKSSPRVLFKFGANHMKRGKNYTNVYDIGNFVAELAASSNASSFHLFVLTLGGTRNKYVPFLHNVADKLKKFETGEDYEAFDARPFAGIAGKSDWSVIDLRPLRPLVHSGKLSKLPRGIADLIWGYDAVLLMPSVRAATLFE